MDGVMGGKRMEKYWKSTEMRERSVCVCVRERESERERERERERSVKRKE